MHSLRLYLTNTSLIDFWSIHQYPHVSTPTPRCRGSSQALITRTDGSFLTRKFLWLRGGIFPSTNMSLLDSMSTEFTTGPPLGLLYVLLPPPLLNLEAQYDMRQEIFTSYSFLVGCV